MLYFDNTRISAFRECPRKFYLRHVRDFTPDGISVDLVFGLAWHEAMNVLWRETSAGATPDKVIPLAFKAFVECWLENKLPAPTAENYQRINENYSPKTPWIALEMLQNYLNQRASFIKECTEVEIERPCAVPLQLESNPNVMYIARMDKIVKHRSEGRLVIEHKTTSWYAKEGGFRSEYIESFSPNSQIDGYNFTGNSLYPDGVRAVWIDAALAHKNVHDKFKFIPIEKQFSQYSAWLIETHRWVESIIKELEMNKGDKDELMATFPKNTSSCHMYSGCVYRSICKFVPNPTHLTNTPAGFKVEKWEPFDTLKIGQIMEKQGD